MVIEPSNMWIKTSKHGNRTAGNKAMLDIELVPSGEHTKSYGKSPFLMGKSTISMAIFHCYVSSPEGTCSTLSTIGAC